MNRPILEKFFASQLDAMARVLEHGQSGKHSANDFLSRGAGWHFAKAEGHMIKCGSHYLEIDDCDTGERHLILAALRLLMADACVASEETDA